MSTESTQEATETTATPPITKPTPAVPTVPPDTIATRLETHQKYLDGNKEGVRFVFANLPSSLQSTFRRANLKGKNLRDADLQGVAFGTTALDDTDLQDTDLTRADLSQTTGLFARDLAGANLSGAKLPPTIIFDAALKNVEEISKHAGALFGVLLALLIFVAMVAFKTRDPQLLTNTGTAVLPVVNVELPVRLFFTVGPLAALVLFVILHLNLQRMWVLLATLPAVFPDKTPLDQRVYPWLMNDLVRRGMKRLQEIHTPLGEFQATIFQLLAYYLPFCVIATVWLRCLARHDWTLTTGHIFALTGLLVSGFYFATVRRRTVARISPQRERKWLKVFTVQEWREIFKRLLQVVCVGAGLSLVSFGGIEGERWKTDNSTERVTITHRSFVPYWLDKMGLSAFAHFEEADVTVPPTGWIRKGDSAVIQQAETTSTAIQEKYDVIPHGAQLREAHLEYVLGYKAFLAKADLRGADLSNADLTGADLTGADLTGAKLSDVNLTGAKLGDAKLSGAVLNRAKLLSAKLEGANLTSANLGAADLMGAKLESADLSGTKLSYANLIGANLNRARLWGANLIGANLIGANLSATNLSYADLSDTNLSDAHFILEGEYKTYWPNDKIPEGYTAEKAPQHEQQEDKEYVVYILKKK
jgi:uncharacterized protein YjbI with pentapeptide repeats